MLNRAFQCDHLREKAVGLAYTGMDALGRWCCHWFGTLPRFQMSETQRGGWQARCLYSSGARPCLGVSTLEDFQREFAKWGIATRV